MERLRSCVAWLRRISPERYLVLALLALTILLWWWALRVLPRPLQVVVIDVGKGDAFLIRCPSGRFVLIDGGSSMPDVGERVLVPNLRLLGVRRLDAVLVTHPDSDHLNGIPAVLQSLPANVLLDNGQQTEGTAYQQLLEAARQRNVPRETLSADDIIHLDRHTRLRILAPTMRPPAESAGDANNSSLVFMLEYRQARMLFTGDLEAAGEEALLAAHPDLRADILKVAHHGSRHGTTPAFLAAMNPYQVVISCPGGNNGDHPSREVLARLREHGVRILRTDVHGQIQLTTRGNGWQVRTYHKGTR